MTSIWVFVAVLIIVGIMAIGIAVHFGKQYKTVGIRKNKLLCVCFTVTACVCIMTAGQILLMFRHVLWG